MTSSDSNANFTEVERTVKDAVSFLEKHNYIPTIVAELINIFHVFILSRRPSIPSSAVNTLLLGIGLVDILSPLIYIQTAATRFLSPAGACKFPATHFHVIADWVFYAIRDDFRRCSVWLGLILAMVRMISLKTAFKKNFDFINESITGTISILLITFFSSLLTICYIFRYQIIQDTEPWRPLPGCPDLPTSENDTEHRFPFKIEEIDGDSKIKGVARHVHLILTAVFEKIIPSIIFPIVAVLLILELRKVGQFRKVSKTSRNYARNAEKTNKLVIYMTITFIVIELPIGVCKLITATRDTYEDAIIPESISKLLNMVYVSMNVTHFFICFTMSTQYRKTVKNVLGCREKPRIGNKNSGGT